MSFNWRVVSFAVISALYAMEVLGATTWGPAFSLGPTKSHIIQATTTLEPGEPPQPPKDDLALWPGMSNSSGDLIQTIIDQRADNSWCGASKTEWCVWASLYNGHSQENSKQVGKMKGNEKVTIDYKRSADAKTWTQTVTLNGKVISTFTSNSGPMTGWGTGTECQAQCEGSTSVQYYTDTTITLEAADTTFGNTKVTGKGVTYEGFESTEGGKVWKIKKITIPAMR